MHYKALCKSSAYTLNFFQEVFFSCVYYRVFQNFKDCLKFVIFWAKRRGGDYNILLVCHPLSVIKLG